MKENYVLLGGWSRNSETYRKLIETTPSKYNVYIIPHTSIIPSKKIPSINKLNENILQKVKEHNLNRVILIGHSLGGALGISFTANHPEYVKKLILIDSEGIPDKRNFSNVVFKWIKDSALIHGQAKIKENIKALIRILQNFPYHFATARYSKNVDVRYDAQKIKTPTLILWGEKDKIVPIENAKEINRLIKGSELVILKGMDHDWLIHKPEKLWSNIVGPRGLEPLTSTV